MKDFEPQKQATDNLWVIESKTGRLHLIDAQDFMFGFFKKRPTPENASSGLRYFQSRHRIDDMYLADLLREANPSGVIKNEIEKMCIIVESAMMPLQLTSQWSGGQGDPHNEELIGYLFGWLDVFKTQVWQVRDFNRSFFHFGFLLWFGGPLATK
jgi:hypothetical protein